MYSIWMVPFLPLLRLVLLFSLEQCKQSSFQNIYTIKQIWAKTNFSNNDDGHFSTLILQNYAKIFISNFGFGMDVYVLCMRKFRLNSGHFSIRIVHIGWMNRIDRKTSVMYHLF